MYKFVFFLLVAVAVAVSNVSALSAAEKMAIKMNLMPIVNECAMKANVGLNIIRQTEESRTLEKLDPCLLACIFRQLGFITEDGIFDVEQAIKRSSEFVSGDDFSKATEFAKNCARVNAETVSDGSEGCDRAKLLAECVAEYKEMF